MDDKTNKKIAEIESSLRESLPIKSVSLIPDFPCKCYQEFLDAYHQKTIDVFIRFNELVVEAYGSRAERISCNAFHITPYIMVILATILAFVYWNFWLLLAIPVIFLGIFTTTPVLMKNIGSFFFFISVLSLGASWLKGNLTVGFLAASFIISYFCITVVRQYCVYVVEKLILKSELLLISLILDGVVSVFPKKGI